jgi:cob(I)alamin adenosyltransferase
MIHVYTGDGKGKTTAAFGLAIRSFGQGGRVLIIQFLKSELSGEGMSAQKLGIEVICRAKPQGFIWEMDEESLRLLCEDTRATFEECVKRAGDFDMLVLDEIICAVDRGIIDENVVLDFISRVPPGLEVVLTGRGAGPRLMEAADYVSQISCVKHPFNCGTPARKGIEY